MFSVRILPAVLATSLLALRVWAAPFGTGPPPEVNKYGLKCSNAPNVVAGIQPNASDIVLTTDLPPSGSSQPWYEYLWCTTGTKTFTFFGLGAFPIERRPNPYLNFYHAFTQSATDIHTHMVEMEGGDGHLDTDGENYYTATPPNTNVKIWVQSQVGKMTYGILHSALTGLALAALHNRDDEPMIFQINDAPWGEVGIGYACPVDNLGYAYWDMKPNAVTQCQDFMQRGKKSGLVEGFS